MSYRPITDVWILARPKVPYYGAYPAGFLERARALLGVTLDDAVLHVCSGRVKDYPYRGFGPYDLTVDIDPELKPDYVMDIRDKLPKRPSGWKAMLVDPPYSTLDAYHYVCGPDVYPQPRQLLARCLECVRIGGRVGFLHYEWPRPPDWIGVRPVALIGVIAGYGNRMRAFSVFERVKP